MGGGLQVPTRKEANEAALELIAAHGLVEGTDYTWEDNGTRLQIEESSLDRVKEEQSAKVDKAYAASQMADVRAKDA